MSKVGVAAANLTKEFCFGDVQMYTVHQSVLLVVKPHRGAHACISVN